MAIINGKEILFSSAISILNPDLTKDLADIREAITAKGGTLEEDAKLKDVAPAISAIPDKEPDLTEVREAITEKGGTLAEDAKFEDVAPAISALPATEPDLTEIREAITAKGGTLEEDAKLKDVAPAIYELPPVTEPDLAKVRHAILTKGGNLAEDAKFDDVAPAIYDLPVGNSTYVEVIDDDTVYEKRILSGAVKYAEINKIGGKSRFVKNPNNKGNYCDPKRDVTVLNSSYLTERGGIFTLVFPEGDGYIDLAIINTEVDMSIEDSEPILYIKVISGSLPEEVVFYTNDDNGYKDYGRTIDRHKGFADGQYKNVYFGIQGGASEPINCQFEIRAINSSPYHENIEAPYYVWGETKVTRVESLGANLFNAKNIKSTDISVNEDGSEILMPLKTSGVGYTPTESTLSELCPDLKVGDAVSVQFTASPVSGNTIICLEGSSSVLWYVGNTKYTVTQEALDSTVALYGNRYVNGYTEQVTLLDFRIVREPSTPFKPYVSYNGMLEDSYFPLRYKVEGYGREHSILDCERKVFIPSNRKVFDGTENFWLNALVQNNYGRNAYQCAISDISGNKEITCNLYPNLKWGTTASEAKTAVNKVWYLDGNLIFITDGSQTVADFKAYLSKLHANGTPLIIDYAPKAPTEVDVSDLMPWDDGFTNKKYLEIESGGVIRFVNSEATVGEVPATITYIRRVE